VKECDYQKNSQFQGKLKAMRAKVSLQGIERDVCLLFIRRFGLDCELMLSICNDNKSSRT
jgi:hypothetical protein